MIPSSLNKPITKLTLAVMLAVSAQNVWACDRPENTEQFDFIQCLSDGLASVKKDDKWGYIDKTGKLVVPLQYDDTLYFFNGLAPVQKDGKWGYIDKTGKVVIPLQYDDASAFGYKNAFVEKDGKKYMIDKTGKVVLVV